MDKLQEAENKIFMEVIRKHNERVASRRFYRVPFKTQLPAWAMVSFFKKMPKDCYVIGTDTIAPPDSGTPPTSIFVVQSYKFPVIEEGGNIPDIFLGMSTKTFETEITIFDQETKSFIRPSWENKGANLVGLNGKSL